jgi:DNA-binding MarR family transcriptional regulator
MQLVQELQTQFRLSSANSVMFSQAVAAKVGIHSTDNETLDFLLLNGPATAGQLSELTGLTTGAVTAMIDRLEKAGYVRREHDKADRRRVIVIPNEEKIYAEIAPYSMRMGMAFEALCAEFSEEELAVVLKFMTSANHAASDVIAKARESD